MDKPTDIMDERNVGPNEAPQTPQQKALASRVQDLFRGAYEAKGQMDLMTKWALFDDYKHGIQNEPLTADHPGSVTNIIHPIIESEISDLTDKPFSTTAEGDEPGDDMYAEDVQHALDFVLQRNQFPIKLDISEHDRLELGTTAIKVYFDSAALEGNGLPTFEIVSPANFFPDPKWTASHLIQECEFIIHAVPRPLSWIRKKFPKLGKYVVRETTCPYDPDLDTANFKTDEVRVSTSEKALLIECYMRDANGELYCVHVANHILLEDSRDVLKGEKVQRRDMYPFVAIPCYTQRGTGWGQGDVELLMPSQDLINDLDDQIRMAARLMGNPQVVVGRNAGKAFDLRKWTNKPGLRIPMVDPNAWKQVPGIPVSSDIPNRREKGFEEANIISGRPDVSRGEAPGQITAAAAIMALQQAGQKQVVHKARMWKQGWSKVLELLYDEMVSHWEEPMWIKVDGRQDDPYKFINPQALQNVPVMVPNLNPMEGEDNVKQLHDVQPAMDGENPVLDEQGQPVNNSAPMTREARFTITLNIGDGLPNDKTYQYQMMQDNAKLVIGGKPAITWEEYRKFMRDTVGAKLEDDQTAMQQLAPPAPPMPMGAPGMPPGAPPNLQVMPGGVPNAR
jgi:hypothetical protein